MQEKKKLVIDTARCKSCALCVRACPAQCLRISSQRNRAGYLAVELELPEKCLACGVCVRTCPEPQCLELAEA